MRGQVCPRRLSWRAGAVALIACVVLLGLVSSASGGVAPNSVGNLDCNHWSSIQQPVRYTNICADPLNPRDPNGRFYDNGWYIGHDEPNLRFISDVRGSGNDVTWTETLPREPASAPTVATPGRDVTHTVELTPALWFSMDLCDPRSYPQAACTPKSDANAPAPCTISTSPCPGGYPGGGAAILELQFYPPGEAPFADNVSCDNSHWCAAIAIDSFEATYQGGFKWSSQRWLVEGIVDTR